MPLTEREQEEELAHFANVVSAFQQYERYSLSSNNRRRKDFLALPRSDQILLRELKWKDKLDLVDRLIAENAKFIRKLVDHPDIFAASGNDEDEGERAEEQDQPAPTQHSHDHGSQSHSHSHDNIHDHSHQLDPTKGKATKKPSESDMDKIRSTLKQFVRDWSVEGKTERDACYKPITEALLKHFDEVPVEERGNFRVLVPGAGLARLAFDIAALGFACQGNEFSHFMLLPSFFILNRTHEIDQETIYPFIHSFSNASTSSALLRPVTIPDVLPSNLPSGSDFSLVAGDFEEIYGESDDPDRENQQGKWNAVATCFFLDTAKNVIKYLRVIHGLLAEGGIWINIGPLLWHYENNDSNEISIELTLEEVKTLARKIGFEIADEKVIPTTYTGNNESMLHYIYQAAFWTAIKRSVPQ